MRPWTQSGIPHMDRTPETLPLASVCSLSHSQPFASPWPCTVARQAPLPVGFARREYCSGLPLPSRGVFPLPGPHKALCITAHTPEEPLGDVQL